MLPDWIQQLAAECPEEDRRQLEDKLKLTQTDYNRRTLAKQEAAGLVRISVMVPKEDAAALKAMAAKLRDKR